MGCSGRKVDEGEGALEAIAREVWEETGIVLPEEQISYFDKVSVRYPEYDFIYHMFYAKLRTRPKVFISLAEHKDCCWASPQDSLALDLVLDEDACIKLFFGI
jgi:8-oxo-dGTP pyrophosphatase MutT (NUDIX family)